MRTSLLFLLYFIPLTISAQTNKLHPAPVESVLKKAGRNRIELEKAINHFRKSTDPLKLKAIYFLVSNMDIHYSANYYWADSLERRVAYDELSYPDFTAAVNAFEVLKKKNPGIHPRAYAYRDIDTITASYLIDNVERAFISWKVRGTTLPFADFCEYILPYRASVEPLQNWRPVYDRKFSWLKDSVKGKTIEQTLHVIANDYKQWFTNTWEIEQRKEPLPRLGALQLLLRKKGNCEDIAGLEVFTLRSQGYPAAVDRVPYWATSTGSHYFNNTFDEQLKPLPFDISTNNVKINNFSREPSKVIRETYSKQPATLATHVDVQHIPQGFMRMTNYLDVTSAHWETKDIKCSLYKTSITPPVAFACVFNGGAWKPTWWGKVQQGSVTFSQMCKGAVFLPVYYIDGKLMPAGDPIVSGYERETTLKPDTLNKRMIRISAQEKRLIFRAGKKYSLFYWNRGWRLIGEKIADDTTTELEFAQVPTNALFILIPEYSERKERPFSITKDGIREWW